MKRQKTIIYKTALEDSKIFPEGIYKLEQIYKRFQNKVAIPNEHFKNRPDVAYPLWKNYIHTVRRNVNRLEFLGNQTYIFK